ncbi:hypothetical protein OKW21_004963 [Catalinimonas alkaloidigena]|nr:hypothetical protein [Catalinimonas alkaloidigena]
MKMITRKNSILFFKKGGKCSKYSILPMSIFALLLIAPAVSINANSLNNYSSKKGIISEDIPDSNTSKSIKPTNDNLPSEGAAQITFSLYDAQTGEPVAGYNPIQEGAIINISSVGKELTVVANLVKKQAGSVALKFNKSKNFQLEEIAPYGIGLNFNLLSDDKLTIYDSWAPELGSNEVTAIAYQEERAKGNIIGKASISFTVVDEPIDNAITFSLYDTKTQQTVPAYDPIPEGAVIDLAEVGKDVQVITNVKNAKSGKSILLGYNDNKNIHQKNEILSLAGDVNNNLNIKGWTPTIGRNSLSAKSFSGLNGEGGQIATSSIQFDIINSKAAEDLIKVSAYPNPTVDELHILSEAKDNTSFTLIDNAGNVVRSGIIDEIQGEVKINVQNLVSGIYYLKTVTENGSSTKKIFIRK